MYLKSPRRVDLKASSWQKKEWKKGGNVGGRKKEVSVWYDEYVNWGWLRWWFHLLVYKIY